MVRDYGVLNGEKLYLVLYFDDIVDVIIKLVDGIEYVYKVECSYCVCDLKK